MATEELRQRKLTVILHADVVGSTELVHRDETVAHRRITEAFSRLSDGLVGYGGRALEVRGDALVAEFCRASDAVSSALAAQAANTEHNAGLDDDIRPELRIGIALGEVVIADNTVTGPGVILAQRFEQLANAGGVCVQGSVYEAVPGRMPFDYESLGEREIKGFDEPVRAFTVTLKPGEEVAPPEPSLSIEKSIARAGRRWIAGVTVVLLLVALAVVGWLEPWSSSEQASQNATREAPVLPGKGAESPPAQALTPGGETTGFAIPDQPSIAVLAFNNMSNDPEQDYFADGIAEDIITDLSKISSLFVIARNTSFSYKGRAVAVPTIARELGIRYVLEGSVRRAGEQIRINAQLIDGFTGGHLWAERYDGTLTDVFALQDQVTEKIVMALSVKLTSKEKADQELVETTVPEAYDAFLKGWGYYRRQTPEDFSRARDYLERALVLDPNYSRAAAALAAIYWETHIRRWHPGLKLDVIETKKRAFEYRDLAMQAPSPLALIVAGDMLMWRGQHEDAISQTRRAIELSPNDAYAMLELAEILVFAGRPEEALSYIDDAARLDPHGEPRQLYIRGVGYFGLDRYEEALATLARAFELNPSFERPALFMAAALGYLGRKHDATDTLRPHRNQFWVSGGAVSAALYFPFKREKDRERLANGLRLAGMKESF